MCSRIVNEKTMISLAPSKGGTSIGVVLTCVVFSSDQRDDSRIDGASTAHHPDIPSDRSGTRARTFFTEQRFAETAFQVPATTRSHARFVSRACAIDPPPWPFNRPPTSIALPPSCPPHARSRPSFPLPPSLFSSS